jgi:hypothetical protein
MVLCCAPSVVRASCGEDYVVVRTSHSREVAPMGQHSAQVPSPLPVRPHKPCNGPNCSRGPSVPPLSIPTVPSSPPPEWGWLCGTLTNVPPGGGALFADPTSPQPISFVSSIFHPPRCAD